jgi:hypothetical protein
LNPSDADGKGKPAFKAGFFISPVYCREFDKRGKSAIGACEII